MLSPPSGLPERLLESVLARDWHLAVTSMSYLAVGAGSHHWDVTDAGGARWFVTGDELHHKRDFADEPLDVAFGRLEASLATAVALRECGLAFVVAPVAAADGAPAVRANEEFAVAVLPFVEGQSFTWGESFPVASRFGVLDMLIAVHTAPPAAARAALAEDVAVPHWDEVELAMAAGGEAGDWGPYARGAARLMADNAAGVRALYARYRKLAAAADPARAVVTHGEPHPGNMMHTRAGWLLIDWDTVLVAQPERDLWSLDPGDGSLLAAYAAATGVEPRPELLEMYRVLWDLKDIAVDLSRFRRPHAGDDDDARSWRGLQLLVGQAGAHAG
jgi:aminoglycoside phosphotransferase (APT) family kinase protein